MEIDKGGSREIDVDHFIQLDVAALKTTVDTFIPISTIQILIGSTQCGSNQEGF